MNRSTAPLADDMREAHVELVCGLVGLKSSVVPPSRPKVADVRARLGAVEELLSRHFLLEEQGGYMDVVRQRHPRLEHSVQRLAAEHAELLRSLAELKQATAGETRFNTRLGAAIAVWVDSVRWHEDRENRLIEDAFDLDLGPGD